MSLIDIAVPADKHISAKEEEKNQEISRPSNQVGEVMEEENNNPHSSWCIRVCLQASQEFSATIGHKYSQCLPFAKDCIVRNSYHP